MDTRDLIQELEWFLEAAKEEHVGCEHTFVEGVQATLMEVKSWAEWAKYDELPDETGT